MFAILDVANAFDTVSNEVLFDKLYYVGYRGLYQDALKCFLANRRSVFVRQHPKYDGESANELVT